MLDVQLLLGNRDRLYAGEKLLLFLEYRPSHSRYGSSRRVKVAKQKHS